jgi:hypothetical protein
MKSRGLEQNFLKQQLFGFAPFHLNRYLIFLSKNDDIEATCHQKLQSCVTFIDFCSAISPWHHLKLARLQRTPVPNAIKHTSNLIMFWIKEKECLSMVKYMDKL